MLLPLIREFNIKLFQKVVAYRGPGQRDFDYAKLATSHFMETKHAIYVSVLISSIATPETEYIIIGGDFLINIIFGVRILYLIKKSKRKTAKKEGESSK